MILNHKKFTILPIPVAKIADGPRKYSDFFAIVKVVCLKAGIHKSAKVYTFEKYSLLIQIMKKKLLKERKFIYTALIAVALSLLSFQSAECGSLRAGVAKANITKDRPTGLVNDPLFARALVLNDGRNKVVIITMDIVNIPFPAITQIRYGIQNELGIDSNHVIVNASHNHWVNDQLADDYIIRTINMVKEAARKMVPVKVGGGSGNESRITMNRRLTLKNGKEWTIRRATPEPQDEMIKEIAGTFDPEIGILRIDRTDGRPLAVLFTFADHNYTGVPNRGTTAGFPGFASKIIEDDLGNGAIAMFMQGAAGDITPVIYKDVNAPKQDEIHGTLLGLSTLEGWRSTEVKKDAGLSIMREELLLPARKDIGKHIEDLEVQKTVILDYFKGEGCGAHGAGTKLNFKTFLPLYIKYMMSPEYPSDYSYRYMQEEKIGINDMKMMDADNKRDMEKYLNCIYKMEELLVTEANLGNLKANKPDDPVKAEIMGLKVGDFVLITFPGEVFAQTGLNIKKASPYENTFVAGYTNGSVGYSPTTDAYSGDAYEVSLSKLAPEWEKIFIEKALAMLKKL